MVARLHEPGAIERREEIRKLIRARPIGTQEELGELLKRSGFAATQATLSRDLARIGARRATRPDGGATYELAQDSLPAAFESFRAVRELVDSVLDNGTLVVVRTRPGAASAVARVIDLSRLPEASGSIAGDDTIFVAPNRGHRSSQLGRKLERLFKSRN